MEIVIFRNLIALPCTLLLFRLEGQWGWPTTKRYKLEYGRGFLLFFSFTTSMMGLAALPLADVAAIRNSALLMITFLLVVMLGETVGPRRWLALIVGFIGVLLIIRPGATTFNIGSIFVLLATASYGLNAMLTRQLGTTDSSATMAYYSRLVYLIVAFILAPLAIFVGEIPNCPSKYCLSFSCLDHPIPVRQGHYVWAGVGLGRGDVFHRSGL